MTNAVLLDNVAHKDLKVRTGYSAEFGNDVNLALVFPTEFAFVQREYPILIRRGEQGGYEACALLGFDKGENLFLDEHGWHARYVPAIQQRGPFLIGLHRQGGGATEPMIHVNLDHPRVNESEGEAVFLDHGGNSPYLDHVSRILQLIHQGAERVQPMFSAFEGEGLLEEMDLEISLDERTRYQFAEFLTISQDRLQALDGAALERLNRPGYLHMASFVATSLGNIDWLVELKNRKRAAAQAAAQA